MAVIGKFLKVFGARRAPRRTKKQLISMCLAEFFVAYLYVLIGCAAQCHASAQKTNTKHLDFLPAAGYDRGLLVAMHIFSHVTKAHGNTAISIGAWILGHIKFFWILIFFMGQISGAFFGIYAVKFLVHKGYKWEGFVTTARRMIQCMSEPFGGGSEAFLEEFGGKDFKPPLLYGKFDVTWRLYFTACVMEIVLSAILMMAYGSAYDTYSNVKNLETVSLRLSFIMYGLLSFKIGGVDSNASLNPIKSFVSIVANLDFRNIWIYMCPFIGTLLGAMIYGCFFRHEKRCIMIKKEHFQ